MKQTKPYGHAHTGSSSTASSPREKPPQSRTTNENPKSHRLTEQGGPSALVAPEPLPVPLPGSRLLLQVRGITIKLAVTLIAITSYVGIRDSVLMQNMLIQLTNKETVMLCKDGTMKYDDWSLPDRLMGKGRFVCTDWVVQNRFVSFPRF
jgi:hypothetical protein